MRASVHCLTRRSWPVGLALLCALVSWGQPVPVAADPTVIARDDFETDSLAGGTGWATGWNVSTAVNIRTTERPYGGMRHLQMRGSAVASRAVDLTGWTDVELAFWAKARSLESGDFVTLEVSSDGTSWQALETWSDDDDDNKYHLYEYDLSGAGQSPAFYLRFMAQMNDRSDYFYVDHIVVQGQAALKEEPAVSTAIPVAPVISTLGAGIVIDGAFTDWAGYPNLPDPPGDATKVRGDLSAFYWGNNGGAEVNYWMIERYAGIKSNEEDDEDDEDDDGDGNSSSKKVKYTIYIDTNNDGSFSGQDDRRVLVDYQSKANHSEVRVRVKSGKGGQTLYSAQGDWGESVAEGGRRVELAVPWSYLGITNGDVIRMYLESNYDDRVPDRGDIQWSPASILGFWLVATSMTLGAVALWRLKIRKEPTCPSG